MNSEILAALDFFERDRGIKREVLLEAINNAVLSAARKAVGPARELRVETDPRTGEMKAIAKLMVVEKVVNKHDEISLPQAQKLKPAAQLGEEVDVAGDDQRLWAHRSADGKAGDHAAHPPGGEGDDLRRV